MRRPLKSEALQRLCQMNVPVETVVDVGVLNGTRELMQAYRDKKHLLVEPVSEYAAEIREIYQKMGIDYTLLEVAASDQDGAMGLRVSSVEAGKAITHARLTGEAANANDAHLREVPVRRLDSLLADLAPRTPYYLKIDVDGAEEAILDGAKDILPACSVVEVEATMAGFASRSARIFAAGFQLFDIVDPSYYDGRLAEVDLIFLNRQIIETQHLELFQGGFDVRLWEAYR